MSNASAFDFGDLVNYIRSDGTRVDALVLGPADQGKGHIPLRYERDGTLVFNLKARLTDVTRRARAPTPPPTSPPSVPPATTGARPVKRVKYGLADFWRPRASSEPVRVH